jgi:phospholipase C
MHNAGAAKWPMKALACALMFALSVFSLGLPAQAGDPDKPADKIKTASPIKHVIIIVGENRSFDHLFATYAPKHKNEKVLNLLSEGIVNADGTPGPNFAKAQQYKIVSAPNGGKFFSSADMASKQLYTTLPAPDLNGVGAVSPYAAVLGIPGGDPGLPPQDQFLLATGGSGLPFTLGPDTRISNVNSLLPGPFQLTGPTMPYDAFAGDTIHQYFQMVQQVDCAIDAEHISRDNPTGCLHDLQSAITTTYSTPPGGIPHDTGQTMEFFNMQNGDAPFFKSLADNYTMSDNYHQPVMGGTGPDSQPLGFADQVFFSDGNGNPVMPKAPNIYNPDPKPGTLNQYKQRAQWFNCNDNTQPGIAAITNYLNSLPYTVDPKCGPGEYWQAVNVNPAFTPKGLPQSGLVVPPTLQPSIGDVLSAQGIPWKYYSGGFNADGTSSPFAGSYCNICNPFEYESNYPTVVADHMRDVTDLFDDLKNGTLPAVSYVKPDGLMDGHPASSKWSLFEAFAQNIVELAQSNPEQWASTAIFLRLRLHPAGGFLRNGPAHSHDRRIQFLEGRSRQPHL